MKKVFIFSFICINLLLAISLATAEDKKGPVTGTWNCQAKGGPNGPMPFSLDLQQSGENVDGSVSSPLGDTRITSGTFKGDALEIHINTDEANYVLTAKLTSGALSGTWSKDNKDQGTWEGKLAGSK